MWHKKRSKQTEMWAIIHILLASPANAIFLMQFWQFPRHCLFEAVHVTNKFTRGGAPKNRKLFGGVAGVHFDGWQIQIVWRYFFHLFALCLFRFFFFAIYHPRHVNNVFNFMITYKRTLTISRMFYEQKHTRGNLSFCRPMILVTSDSFRSFFSSHPLKHTIPFHLTHLLISRRDANDFFFALPARRPLFPSAPLNSVWYGCAFIILCYVCVLVSVWT